MIMRRLALRIRAQDWLAVGIELVVVVLGVMIALQATNWNDDRVTARKAAVFIERLEEDLLVEAWGYEMQIGYYSDVRDNATLALAALEGEQALEDEALLIAAYRATQYNGNTRRRATYDELTSTGEMGLISDRRLRELAMEVYNAGMFDDVVSQGVNSSYRREFRTSLPHSVQRAVSSACGDKIVVPGDFEGVNDSLDYPCKTGLSAAQLADSVARLRANPNIVPQLRLRLLDVETSLFNFADYYQTLRGSLAELVRRNRAPAP